MKTTAVSIFLGHLIFQSAILFQHSSSVSIGGRHKSTENRARSWHIGPWSTCTSPCGGGTQSRSVVCKSMGSDGVLIHEDDVSCNQPKPSSSRECNVDEPCPEWQTAPWSNCDAMCDEGQQSREVVCILRRGDSSKKHMLPESRCDRESKPPTSRTCNNGPCSGFEWITSEWSGCHESCEAGRTETRLVVCSSANGDVFPVDKCMKQRQPPTKRTCVVADSCRTPPQWHASQWGQCSSRCGNGQQYRKVFCAVVDRDRVIRRSEKDCVAATKMSEQQDCYGDDCSTTWFTGAYGKCSKPCDGGERRRTTVCISTVDLRQVNDALCDSTSRPDNLEQCNRQQCGDDDEFLLPTSNSDCALSEFGCCPDGVTSAEGPNRTGCLHRDPFPDDVECIESDFGCCPDGVMLALGPNKEGCGGENGKEDSASEHNRNRCSASRFGCCPDGVTPKRDSRGAGCEEEDGSGDEAVATSCSETIYGCCPDGISASSGPEFEGCSEKSIPCHQLEYGCCLDGSTPALGPDYEGCRDKVMEPTVETPWSNGQTDITPVRAPCENSQYGCCPGSTTAAVDHVRSNCQSDCASSTYGCCPDGVAEARGLNFEDCEETLSSRPACANSQNGCCSDGVTAALGPNDAGCPSRVRQGALCKLPTETGSCGEYTIQWFFDPVLGICTRNWYSGCEIDAHHFDSEEECQSVCVTPPAAFDKCFLPVSVGRCRASSTRYFYNATALQCQTFVYGGCDGNANNFNEFNECVQECEEPMRPEVCTQAPVQGPCRGNFERYHFDSNSNMCVPFVYGGCHGNDNRFETIEACETRCKQPATHICSLPMDQGPCRAAMEKWYYNSQTGVCDQFIYGGCQGNENKFSTKEECDNTCSKEIKKERLDVCSLPKETGPCQAYFERWHYDRDDGTCKQFVYGGCQGNENRFESEKECRESCGAAPPVDVCSLPAVQGPCYDYVLRLYYDQTRGRCDYFYYGGCDGNENNFVTSEECEKRCAEPETPQVVITDSPGNDHMIPKAHDIPKEEVEQETDVCSLNYEFGDCDEQRILWYFDDESRMCERFWYSGCGGNENRFETEEECLARCVVSEVRDNRDNNHESPDSQGNDHMISKAEEIRREEVEQETDVCSLNYESGVCDDQQADERVLWYFDDGPRMCRLFSYSGCGGNENRFETEEECLARCVASEVRDNEDSNHESPEHCVDNDGNTIDHGATYTPTSDLCLKCTCNNGNRDHCMTSQCVPPPCDWVAIEGQCCQFYCRNNTDNQPVQPTTDVCSLNYEFGDCDDQRILWYFDDESRICERFWYSGCGGNENRFETEEECLARCVASEVRDNVGNNHESPDHCVDTDGNTIAHGATYRPTSDPCLKCTCNHGNREHCRMPDCRPPACDWVAIEGQCCQFYCRNNTDNQPAQPLTDVCSLNHEFGDCDDQRILWYFDHESQMCERFWYSGCGGNENRFETEEECLARCVASEVRDNRDNQQELPEHCVDNDGNTIDHGAMYTPTSDPCFRCTCNHGSRDHCMTSHCVPPACDWVAIEGQCCQFNCRNNTDNQPVQPITDVCSLNHEFGDCDDQRILWYFDDESRMCERFWYSGCGGNENRFETEEECIARCVASEVRDNRDNQHELPGHCVDNDGNTIDHGATYTPTSDPCLKCTCNHGRRDRCMTSHCAPPACDWVAIEGQCCQFYCRNNTDNQPVEPVTDVDDSCSTDCQLDCPFGFVQGNNGCQVCRCHTPCKAVDCSPSFKCTISDVICPSALCPTGMSSCHDDTASSDVKVGQCPVASEVYHPQYECSDLCHDDWLCPGDEKCCVAACGGRVCSQAQRTEEDEVEMVKVHDHHQDTLAVAAGETLTMHCRSEATDFSRVVWYKDRDLIPNDPTSRDPRMNLHDDAILELTSVTPRDAVTFTCLRIVDEDDVTSAVAQSFKIEVQEPLVETSVHQPSGQSYEISQRSIHNEILYQPSLGASFRLRCPSDDTTPHITWYKDGAAVYEDERHMVEQDGAVLLIHRIEDSDGGNYACERNNGVGETLRYIFTVEPLTETNNDQQPSYEISQRSIHNEILYQPSLGASFRLRCPSDDTTPHITWYKDGAAVYEDERHMVEQDGAVLLIHRIEDSDGGNYACERNNGVGETLRYIFTVEPLIRRSVYVPRGSNDDDDQRTLTASPRFTDDQSLHRSLGPSLGVTVELECPTSGNPTPHITWYKDGAAVYEDERHMVEQDGAVLLIHRIEDSDGGNYECEVNNGVGEALRRTFTVEPLIERSVYVPRGSNDDDDQRTLTASPRFTDDQSLHRSLGPSLGVTVELECPTSGNPTPHITWYKDGAAVYEDERHMVEQDGAVLLIHRIEDSDGGNYECEVNNGVGEALRRTFTVELLIEPSVAHPYHQTEDSRADQDSSNTHVTAANVNVGNSAQSSAGGSAPAGCEDRPWYANCDLIIEGNMCKHAYFSVFCCKSCFDAGQLP